MLTSVMFSLPFRGSTADVEAPVFPTESALVSAHSKCCWNSTHFQCFLTNFQILFFFYMTKRKNTNQISGTFNKKHSVDFCCVSCDRFVYSRFVCEMMFTRGLTLLSVKWYWPLFLCSFLPNYVSHKDTYQQKAFCGVYSEDGNMFLSACQGK